MALNLSNYIANQQALAVNTNTGIGSPAVLTIYSGTQPANANTGLSGNTALAVFNLPSAGGNSVTNNVITVTIGAWATVTASNTGTATFFRIVNGANVICDGTVSTSGADMNINSTSISSGAEVVINSFSYTITL